MNILILYSTVDGHTQHICEHIKQFLESHAVESQANMTITMMALDAFYETRGEQDKVASQLGEFDMLIFGASIRYGKHRPQVSEFIKQHKDTLARLKTGFFSVNLVARKPEKNTPETNSYIKKLLEQTDWQPDVVAVFAGKLDYGIYRYVDKQMIKFIMWMTKGPTHSDKPIVFTDYARVDAFCEQMLALTTKNS